MIVCLGGHMINVVIDVQALIFLMKPFVVLWVGIWQFTSALPNLFRVLLTSRRAKVTHGLSQHNPKICHFPILQTFHSPSNLKSLDPWMWVMGTNDSYNVSVCRQFRFKWAIHFLTMIKGGSVDDFRGRWISKTVLIQASTLLAKSISVASNIDTRNEYEHTKVWGPTGFQSHWVGSVDREKVGGMKRVV